ncbi:hypothetical protein BH10BAC1_BH10BAC1_10680 [soil metagenome]
MKLNYFYFICLLAFITACGSATKEEPQSVDTTLVVQSKPESAGEVIATDMDVFTNMEIVSYCLFVPLKEYDENYDGGDKAKHVFVHKTKKENEIIVQGLLRADSSIPIDEYFKNSVEEMQLEGKGIEKQELLLDKNCFYVKGYWSNLMDKSRFIEVCWLREGDVVKYYSAFDIKDTALWHERLAVLLKAGSDCK